MIAMKKTFLPKVCQLVSLSASPKQPQSLIGLKRARYSVKSVITPIKIVVAHAVILLHSPNKRKPPRRNSKEQRETERAGAITLRFPRPITLRYSSILIAPPIGSTPLTNPEKSRRAASRMRESSDRIYWAR